MKIGAITCNWNGERFIKAHLKMLSKYVDRIIVLQGTAPWKDYASEYKLSSIADESELIIKKEFPNIEIYPARVNEFCCDLYNQGQEILEKDCDIALRLDVDMFLTDKDFKRLIKFIKEEDFPAYRVDFKKCNINYYYNFNHGVKDMHGWDVMALKTKYRYRNLIDVDEKFYTISWEDFSIHHLKGWKKTITNKWLLEHKCNDCVSAPKEIIDLFK